MGKNRIKSLEEWIGRETEPSDWLTVDQEKIDAFAECTGDHQWIHVDVERARKSPLKGTVAHGFLLLSLLPRLSRGNPLFENQTRMKINYGFNRLRFISPVHAGKRIRLRTVLKKIDKKGFRKRLLTIEATLEIEGADKPALVAELLVLAVG
jgi:acyl dehydratase